MELMALSLISTSSSKTRMLPFQSICEMALPKIRRGMECLCQDADTAWGELILQPSLQGGGILLKRAELRQRVGVRSHGGFKLQCAK